MLLYKKLSANWGAFFVSSNYIQFSNNISGLLAKWHTGTVLPVFMYLLFLKTSCGWVLTSNNYTVIFMPGKQSLRKTYLQKRMELSPDEYAYGNQKLLQAFGQINFGDIGCISMFLPMLERREPDTFLMIDWLKQNHPQIKMAFPRSDFATCTMQHFLEDASLQIDTNNYGIPEPIKGTLVPNSEVDMVIVPLLAFDRNGYRVGYGKGFYDRFMAQCKPQARFVGLSFFEPVDKIDDLDQYDMPLHQCITPHHNWLF